MYFNIKTCFWLKFSFFGVVGTLEVWKMGMDWMRNKIPNPKSHQTRNWGECIRRYAKDTIRFFFLFSSIFFTNFTLMVDIIILNPIGSYKVNFNGTIFVLRPIFYLKTPLMRYAPKYIYVQDLNGLQSPKTNHIIVQNQIKLNNHPNF